MKIEGLNSRNEFLEKVRLINEDLNDGNLTQNDLIRLRIGYYEISEGKGNEHNLAMVRFLDSRLPF